MTDVIERSKAFNSKEICCVQPLISRQTESVSFRRAQKELDANLENVHN